MNMGSMLCQPLGAFSAAERLEISFSFNNLNKVVVDRSPNPSRAVWKMMSFSVLMGLPDASGPSTDLPQLPCR